MTITATKLTDYELLDASGNVLRTVRGEATAVILRNAGECASYRPVVGRRVALVISAGTTVGDLVKFAALAQAAEDEPSPEFDPTDEYLREEMKTAFAAGAVYDEVEEFDVPDEINTATIGEQWVTIERDIVDPVAEEQAVYAASAVWKAVPKPEVDSVELNARFAMADPVKPDYASKKITDLRKMASQAGMRAVTGLDPYRGVSKEQLIEFLER